MSDWREFTAEASESSQETTRTPGQRDPDRTRRAILEAATEEFVQKGFAGASVNEIADRANVNKRMLYHYFGKKGDLYVAVLERVYTALRAAQTELKLSDLPPWEAIDRLVLFTWRYYLDHPELLRLFAADNMLGGTFSRQSGLMRQVNTPLQQQIETVLERGRQAGLFRDGVDAIQLYLTIAALAAHYVETRHTLSNLLAKDMSSEEEVVRRVNHILDVIHRYLTA